MWPRSPWLSPRPRSLPRLWCVLNTPPGSSCHLSRPGLRPAASPRRRRRRARRRSSGARPGPPGRAPTCGPARHYPPSTGCPVLSFASRSRDPAHGIRTRGSPSHLDALAAHMLLVGRPRRHDWPVDEDTAGPTTVASSRRGRSPRRIHRPSPGCIPGLLHRSRNLREFIGNRPIVQDQKIASEMRPHSCSLRPWL